MSNPSTGPRTEEGKARSSQNARKHGLSAEAIPDDLRPVFNNLQNELEAFCRPEGPYEKQVFDKLVTARWNMLRALDLENELYDESEGRDPLGHPATQARADLYSRYYIRHEGSYNRAFKQLKDSQTNRACQAIQANPTAPWPTLPLADLMKIQRFAKRTPPKATTPATPANDPPKPADPTGESEDILKYYSADEAEEIRAAAETTGVTVNFIVSQSAKYGIQCLYRETYGAPSKPVSQNEPNSAIRD